MYSVTMCVRCARCDRALSSSVTLGSNGLSVSQSVISLATSGVKFIGGLVVDVTCLSIILGISVFTVVSRKRACRRLRRKTAGLSPESSPEGKVPKTDSVQPPATVPTIVQEDTVTPEARVPIVTERREGRKVLPPIPDSETEAEMSASVNNKNSIMTTGSGNGQFRLEYILMNEFNMLHKQKLPGIYVIPSALSPLIWNGVIFIRQGLYQEAVFRFNLNIPENYPNGDCPRVFFEHPVFHPVVDPKTGELDVKREFKKWRRNANYLWQVLMYIRRIFFKIDPKCPSNTEAAELYEHNMDMFRKKIEETVRSSKEVLYNPVESNDAHMIRFSPWDSGIHEEAKSDMLTRKKNRSDLETEPHKRNGLSWIKPGTTQTFAKDDVNSLG